MPTPCWLKHLCSIRALVPVCLSVSLCLSLSLSLCLSLVPRSAEARWAHFLSRASKTLSRRCTVPSPTQEHAWCLHAAARALRTGLYWLSAKPENISLFLSLTLSATGIWWLVLLLLEKYPRVERQDHMVDVCLTFKEIDQRFPEWLYHFAFLPVLCSISSLRLGLTSL